MKRLQTLFGKNNTTAHNNRIEYGTGIHETLTLFIVTPKQGQNICL